MTDARVNCAEFLSAVGIFALLLFGAACGRKAEKPATVSPPVQNLTATLEDEVHDLPGGEIEWSTYWRLCWPSYEGASEYELQSLTSEGASNKFRRQSERCFRLEVAAGQNPKSEGLRNRDLQLALRSTELSYRVRAVLADGHFSEWSQALSAAKTAFNKDP
jgi:hypothetical protein